MVIAIDPSLRSCGFFIPEGDKSLAIRSTEHEYTALHKILEGTAKIFKTYRPEQIVIERLAFSKHSRSVSAMGEVHGIIKALAVHYNVEIVEMSSNTWKSYIFGSRMKAWPRKGKTKKATAVYLDRVKKATGRSFQTTDEADAYMIYRTFINGQDTLFENII